MKHRISHVPLRGTAAATAVAAAAAAVTLGVVAWPAEGEPRTAELTSSRLIPNGSSATLAGKAPSQG